MNTTKIKKIARVGNQKAYDLEVDAEDHNFVAEGLLTSNCLGPNELVKLTNGTQLPLNKVRKGDLVCAYDVSKDKDIYTEVVQIYHSKNKLYSFEFSNDEKIICSMEHKFLCADMVMRPIKEILFNGMRIKNSQGGFSSIKTNFQVLGNHECIDLEVAHQDHNFYCNNLVVSNSHAVAYSALSALTTYLKFNYPTDFFIECLAIAQNKQDSTYEISLIQEELKEFGIQLLPPDLVCSEMDFSVEGKNIRFGLSAIKGISSKSLNNIQDFIDTKVVNKFQVFEAAKQAGVNVAILAALIQAGVLSSFEENRTLLVLEAQLWSVLTDRERKYCIINGDQYGYHLLKMIKDIHEWPGENGKKFTRGKTRFETIRKKYEPYKNIYLINKKFPEFASYVFESKLLGYSYSYKLKEIFKTSLTPDLISIDEIKSEPSNIRVECVVEVMEAKVARSKKSNERYLKMKCRDDSGSFDFMLYGAKFEKYALHNTVPEEGNYLHITGEKGDDIVWINGMAIQDEKIHLKTKDLKIALKKEEKRLAAIEENK